MFGLKKLLPALSKARLPLYANERQRLEILSLVQAQGQRRGQAGVRVGESSIPNAGYGLRADGPCSLPAHRIVCLYPGRFFPPLPMVLTLDEIPLVQLHTPVRGEESEYLIYSALGGFLDEPVQATQQLKGAEQQLWAGHRIQHPPKGVKPNVDVVHFMWKDVLQGQGRGAPAWEAEAASQVLRGTRMYAGRWFVDHRAAQSHGGGSREVQLPTLQGKGGLEAYWRCMAGLAVVTTREIPPEEELYLDYELGAQKASRLSWYHAVQYED